ncbi:protein ALP1-like [Rutidosis leptorrhynchoides]|uniref:protein ALP1-like n=1 Tax=Rutidosis leptorrhynchoides TaxID=125765 RepID=UPI003A995F50
MAEELDAEEAEEAANDDRVRKRRVYLRRDREEAEPLPSHFEYFIQKRDALGRLGFTTEQKITSALRQLAYGTAVDIYLRKPTSSDIARLYSAHEEKHGFKGMLGSIDCMHWKWKNCPVAWKGQYTSGHQKHPTIVLEAIASYDTWIWHAFFGAAGANNDVNVLNQSSLFDDIKNGNAPFAPFTVNGHDYLNGYYLSDGIYPDWATLIKAYSTPTDEPRAKFKQFQESARKDVERTFGVLQGRFHILQMAGRPHSVNKLRRILYYCVLLHNMIVEDNGFNITWLEEELLATDEANPNYVRNRSTSRDVREQEIRDRNVHDQLRQDLTEHIWSLPPNFRTMNA